MAQVSLRVLGPAQVIVGGQPCGLTPRLLGLLVYLAVEGTRAHRRESLAALFWPDKPSSAALGNLRSALRDLRAILCERNAPSPCLLATSAEIQMNRKSDFWLDVSVFTSLLDPGRSGAADLDALTQAAALYRGPFLEEFVLSDSTEWEEWVLIKREALHRNMQGALRMLSSGHEARREYEQAIAWTQRAIDLDPWQEEMYRQLMRLLALSGRRSAAIVQYRHCEQVMRRDLDMALSAETITLYEQIRDNTPPLSPPALESPVGGPSAQVLSHGGEQRLSPYALPSDIGFLSRLVARKRELSWLEGHLRQALDGQGRVVFVTGEAGSGKTALVEGFCREAMALHSELLVALAHCCGRGGARDAYQPFREILYTLTTGTGGNAAWAASPSWRATLEPVLEGAPWAGGVLHREHARRLQSAQPIILAALSEAGPDLVRLVSGLPSLLAHAEATNPKSAPWLARLGTLLSDQGDAPHTFGLQAALHEQTERMLRALAQRQPLLLVLDDLHWADPSSLDLLFHLGRHLHGCRILIIGTFRPEEDERLGDDAVDRLSKSQGLLSDPLADRPDGQHPLEALSNEFQRQWGYTRLDLGESEAEEFVWAYLDTQPNALRLPFRKAVLRHTGGNPLFTVEFVRAMQERGDLVRDAQGRWIEGPRLDWERLPPRVEGSIAQRVGRLISFQQRLLTAASVIGVDFHAETLARVVGQPVESVVSTLSGTLRRGRLVEALGIEKVAVAPRPVEFWSDESPQDSARRASKSSIEPLALSHYRFRHELFQTYLYGRLDSVACAHLHGVVGDALEEIYGPSSPLIAGQLARHFEAANRPGKATGYLLQAGQQAAWLGAHRQAISCFKQALTLLGNLPNGAERAKREFAVQMAMDDSLVFASGWGAPERLRSSDRAYELGQQGGTATAATLQALRAIANLSAVRGEFDRATVAAHQLLALAQRVENPLYIASAHATLAVCAAMQADLSGAWEHVTATMDFCRHRSHMLTAEEIQALRPHTEFTAAFVLLATGRLDQARQQIAEILAYEYHDSPQTIVAVHGLTAMFYALLHDDRLARRHAEEALQAIGESADAPELHAWDDSILGWVQACEGQAQQGIPRLLAAIQAQPPQGTLIFRFSQLAFLVEAYLAAGNAVTALDIVQQAIARVEKKPEFAIPRPSSGASKERAFCGIGAGRLLCRAPSHALNMLLRSPECEARAFGN